MDMAQALNSDAAMTTDARRPIDIAAGTWVLEPAASRFEFQVKHFWGLITVKGHFSQFEGHAAVDASGPISVALRIDAATVDTKHKQRDKHLRSADFFDVERQPTITFASRRVVALGADRLKVEGDLTAAGRSRPVEFEARLSAGPGRSVTVEAEVSVDRTAFGMTWSPLRMASATALLVVRAQFNKQGA
jgi:polyisoprenoid-binding protein YceI